MEFDKIVDSILSTTNEYEKKNRIETLDVILVAGKEELDWSIFSAKKSDNSNTLFFAYKHKRASNYSWKWFCPSKTHISGLLEFNKVYWDNEKVNKKSRKPLDSLKKPTLFEFQSNDNVSVFMKDRSVSDAF